MLRYCYASHPVCQPAAHQLPLLLPLLLCWSPRPAGSKGYVPVRDTQDGYSFLYPFGWQEVQVEGQDVVYKDVIEPLESVSVSLVPTEKAEVGEFGDAKEVAFTLADKVLTAPNQEIALINVGEVSQRPRRVEGAQGMHAVVEAKGWGARLLRLLPVAPVRAWRATLERRPAAAASPSALALMLPAALLRALSCSAPPTAASTTI